MSASNLDPKNADKRTAERYLQRGQLDEKAWQKHLSTLPDVAEKAAPIESILDDDSDDFDDEDDEA
jgi:hypothetical protein